MGPIGVRTAAFSSLSSSTSVAGCRFRIALLGCALLCSALLSSGCGRNASGPESESTTGWIRLVRPADGDSVAGRVALAAEVDLDELVHRVTFYVDDAPIIVATQTPWESDWLPPAAMMGKVVHLRVEATGATQRITSSPVSVWIAPRGSLPAIVGPHRSVWVERSPDNFLQLQRCGSDAGTPDVDRPDAGNPDVGTPDADTPDAPPEDTPDPDTPNTVWSGDLLRSEFRSELLPVAMLPVGPQRVRAVRSMEQAEGWVHPFDYPGNGTPLAASESLALAIRARDGARVQSLLSPASRFDSCGDRIVPSLQGDRFSTALRRFLDDPEMVDLAWSWRLTAIGQWSRDGKSVALVRADNLRWSFGRLTEPCEEPVYDWGQSGAGGGELLWTRAESGEWLLQRWTDHVSRGSPAFIDHLSGSNRIPNEDEFELSLSTASGAERFALGSFASSARVDVCGSPRG